MSQALRSLERFLELSEAMALAADEQEWEELVELGERRKAISDLWSADQSAQLLPSEQARGRTIMERCQRLDSQVFRLVKERQEALRVLLRETQPAT